MQRSIVPAGFESTAHPVFREFIPPIPLPEECICLDSKDSAVSSNHNSQVVPIIPDTAEEEMANLCAICRETISDLVTLVQCKHHFCSKCILSWYKVKVNCPVCKHPGSYFLKGCDEIKLWTVDGTHETDSKPPKEIVHSAISAHKKICHRTVNGIIDLSHPRKRAKMS